MGGLQAEYKQPVLLLFREIDVFVSAYIPFIFTSLIMYKLRSAKRKPQL